MRLIKKQPSFTLLLSWLASHLLAPAALAGGIISDGSLAQTTPTTISTLSPGSFVVPQAVGATTTDGSTLFHSFQEFNVHLNQTVLLDGANTLQRIIMRVTGTNPSELSGHLGLTAGNTASNVYLINPNGVTVNANAVIDMPAVFHYSNLPIIQFADGSFFSAVDAKASTLSSAPINAFGFVQPVGATVVAAPSATSIPYDGSANLTGTTAIGLPYYIKRILPANTVLPTAPAVQTAPTTTITAPSVTTSTATPSIPINPTVTQPTIVAPTATAPVAAQPIPATVPTTTVTASQPVSVIPSPPTASTAPPPTTAVTSAQPVVAIPPVLPSSTGTVTANPLSPLTALVSTAATIIQAPAYNVINPPVATGATNSVADKISQAIQRTKLITSETADQPVLSGFIANNQISPVIVNQDSLVKQSPLIPVNGLLKSAPVFSTDLLIKPDSLVKTETWVTQEIKPTDKNVSVKQTTADNNTKSNAVSRLAIPVGVAVSAKRLRLEGYIRLPCSRANSLTRSGKGGLPANETRFGFVPPATVATPHSPPAVVSQTGAVIPSTLSQSGASFPCVALSF